MAATDIVLGDFYGGKSTREKRKGCLGFVHRDVLFFSGCTLVIESRDQLNEWDHEIVTNHEVAIHPPKPKAFRSRTAGYSDNLVRTTLSPIGGEVRIRNTETGYSVLVRWGYELVPVGWLEFREVDPEGSEKYCGFGALLSEGLFPALPVKPTKVAM